MKLKKIVESFGLGELPSSRLKQMKWNPVTGETKDIKEEPKFDPKSIVEYTDSDLKTVSGMINQKALKEFVEYGDKMADDLEKEGFDDNAIKEFFIAFAKKHF